MRRSQPALAAPRGAQAVVSAGTQESRLDLQAPLGHEAWRIRVLEALRPRLSRQGLQRNRAAWPQASSRPESQEQHARPIPALLLALCHRRDIIGMLVACSARIPDRNVNRKQMRRRRPMRDNIQYSLW